MHIKREARHKVLMRARMRAGGPPTEVCVRDISSRGLLIQASAPPPRGTYVELLCGDQRIVGRVVWGKDRRFGVRTSDPLNVRALLRGIPAGAAQRAEQPRPSRLAHAGAQVRADSYRPLAKAMEFAVICALAVALVAAVGAIAFETLSAPLAAVSARMGGK